jgi:CheY-like chemotaxis protein
MVEPIVAMHPELFRSEPRGNIWREIMTNEVRDIVVVDDDSVLLSVLSELLKEHGYAVRTASHGFEALAAMRERVPDVLLSDLNMPRMTGFELLSIVRRRFPAIAVIAMSGAYAGLTAGPGIAADGFYAKGLSSVFGLLEIIRSVEHQDIRQSRRAAVPIWIPGLPIDQGDLSTTGVSCPECLRVFSHPVHNDAGVPQECRCPHCQYPVQLAIVAQLQEAYKVGQSLSTTAHRTDVSEYAH